MSRSPTWEGAPPRAPPLRSTGASKEVVYDIDSDTLPEEDSLVMPDDSIVPSVAESARLGMGRVPYASQSRTSLDMIGQRVRSISQALDPEQLPDWLRRGAGVFEGTVNMANSILGAGIVGLPYSMRESGFVAGIVLLVGIALLTDWTIRLIVLNAKLSGRTTYIDIMEHCFGHKGKGTLARLTQSPCPSFSLSLLLAACAHFALWWATRSPTSSRPCSQRSKGAF